MASSVEIATAVALPLQVFIIKSNLKLDVYACILTKRIIIITSSFCIVLLTHGSERRALQKQKNVIALILHV